jgi:5-methyltetrahydrofolate--homocysteine methyltransferase
MPPLWCSRIVKGIPFGYPACPDLEDREKLVRLLEPERIGVHLAEELQLHPEQSTDVLVVHPEAKYVDAS